MSEHVIACTSCERQYWECQQWLYAPRMRLDK